MLQWMLAAAPLDVIRFTVTPVASKTVTLQDFSAPLDATVMWGDGATDRVTANAPVSHTYADATPRQIIIRGRLGGFWHGASPASGAALVTSLDEISSESLTSLADTFRQCVGLVTIPPAIAAPHVSNFTRTFFDCQSITSDLPALWLTHAAAQHPACFTRCFSSLFGKYGMSCPHRQHVPAVPQQTYYQHYGTSCPACRHIGAVPATTFFQRYQSCLKGGCPHATSGYNGMSTNCACGRQHMYGASYDQCAGGAGMVRAIAGSWKSGVIYDANVHNYICDNCGRGVGSPPHVNVADYVSWNQCKKIYSPAISAWNKCMRPDVSNTGACNDLCRRIYQSAQSAYYKCVKSGVGCQGTSCPHALVNQASVDAAKAAGWA